MCLTGFVLLAAAVSVGDPLYLWSAAWWYDRPSRKRLSEGMVDDASRLNLAAAETIRAESDPLRVERQLSELLERARRDDLKVSIAGARHSMGGHTIYPGGLSIDMSAVNGLRLDAGRRILTAGAGARWRDIVPFLNGHGLSVGVMQSNDDFTVGGSISVNCHGWQHGKPPIASTVESFRLMQADGAVVRCSRSENRELLAAALGGYGLLGIILDVELRVVPNERYRVEVGVVPVEKFAGEFLRCVRTENTGMALGRLCVVPGAATFLHEATLVTFRRDPWPVDRLPGLQVPALGSLRRQVYRAQIESPLGKQMRWQAEKSFGRKMASSQVSRNQLLHESTDVFREQNQDRTDILHEYFVPPARFEEFVDRMRTIVPRHGGDLLNVTVRHVLPDDDTMLRYADREMLALVLLFNQRRTSAAEHVMESMTRELIDAALDCEGRYYLPYRLHATAEQFRRAYPQADKFFELKRRYDPEERFQNAFYLKYGGRTN